MGEILCFNYTNEQNVHNKKEKLYLVESLEKYIMIIIHFYSNLP